MAQKLRKHGKKLEKTSVGCDIDFTILLSMLKVKCSKRCTIVLNHLRLSLNTVYMVLMCKVGVKYQNASRAVGTYVHYFRICPGCALIGACVLIRMNTVFYDNAILLFCYLWTYNFR